jgi:diaminopimelate decarboxylase
MDAAAITVDGAAGIAVQGGNLCVGGVPLSRLVERVGSTPFYAYSRAAMTETVARLRRALPQSVHLHYAIKANPMPAVVQHLAGLVDGFDVASGQELKIALDAPVGPDQVSFAGPGKTASELRQAAAAGIVVSAESAHQLRMLAAIGREMGLRPPVILRVNPDFELRAAGMQMGGGPKAFGIDAEQIPELLREIAGLAVEFRGFQIFCGSQNLNPASIIETQSKVLDLAIELGRAAPAPIRLLNIGGGFGIPYFAGDAELDIEAVGAALGQRLAALQPALGPAEIVLELGRYLVGPAGIYVCRVIDRKVSRGKIFVVTDGGLHHHLAASGNFGQVVRRNYPIMIGNRAPGTDGESGGESVEIVGCLCTPIDVLGRAVTLPAPEIGDLVVVMQSGAYGRSASPLGFLSHPEPAEIVV